MSPVGALPFVAPEVCAEQMYDFPVDVWGFGATGSPGEEDCKHVLASVCVFWKVAPRLPEAMTLREYSRIIVDGSGDRAPYRKKRFGRQRFCLPLRSPRAKVLPRREEDPW